MKRNRCFCGSSLNSEQSVTRFNDLVQTKNQFNRFSMKLFSKIHMCFTLLIIAAFLQVFGFANVAAADGGLSIIKAASSDSVTIRSDLTYTITVSNESAVAQTNVMVTDVLPTGLDYKSSSSSQGSTGYNAGTRTVTANLGTIAAGGSATITIEVTPIDVGRMENTASVVSSQTTSPVVSDPVETYVHSSLSIDKVTSSSSVTVGQDLVYTITLRNIGTGDQTNVVLTDELPASVVEYKSSTTSQGTISYNAAGYRVIANLGTIAEGGSATVTIVVVPTRIGRLENSASVVSDQQPSPVEKEIVVINVRGGLSITKTDAPDPVTVGSDLTYTITVNNIGTIDQTNVTVRDTLPVSVNYKSSTSSQGSIGYSAGTRTVTASLGTIAAGGSATITIVVIPTQSGQIQNIASATSNEDTDPVVTDPVITNVTGGLSIIKTASPSPVPVRTDLTYTITVSNADAVAQTNVVVTDILPVGVDYKSSASSQGSTSYAAGTRTVTANLGTIAGGASATITIVVTPTQVGQIENIASVASSQTTDPVVSDPAVTDVTGGLSIIKTDSPDPVIIGSDLTYTVTVNNAGSIAQTNVVVTDTLPVGVNYKSSSSSQGSTGYNAGTRTVTANLGTIAAGGSATVTIVVTPTQVGRIENTASVASSQTTDPVVSDPAVTDVTEGLSIIKIASPSPVPVGEDLTYTITVNNAGAVAQTNVVVTDILPVGVDYKSSTSSQGSTGYDAGTRTVTANLGTIAAGGSATITIVVTPTDVGRIQNIASVVSSQAPNPVVSDPAVTDVTGGLSIDKTASPDPVTLGEDLTYTITINNAGAAAQTNVIVTDTLPVGVDYKSSVSSQGSTGYNAGTRTVTANLGTIAGGSSATVTIVVTPKVAGTLDNTASVISDKSPEPEEDTVASIVDPNALLVIKTASKETAGIGDFVEYSLSVENIITTTVEDVVVSDTLPAGFRYKEGSARVDGVVVADPAISSDGRTLTFSLGDIAPHAVVKVNYVVEIGAGASLGKAINSASASGTGGVLSNIARATVTVKEDLFSSKCFIVGRVIADNCQGTPKGFNDGVEGVRIYLEDGTYAITDKEGKFHFEGIDPGVHVVQLDLDTVSEKYDVVPCEKNTRFAGKAFSQFVDIQPGTMWRTDFHLKAKPKIVGQVIADNCQPTPKGVNNGVEGVKVYLDDKIYAVTDEEGRFQFEQLSPGTHVVQLDQKTILEKYEAVSCEKGVNPRSRSINVQSDAMYRADFHFMLKPKMSGQVDLKLRSRLDKPFVIYQVDLKGSEVLLRNRKLTIVLPKEASYVASSSVLDGKALPDPEVKDNTLTYRLGDVPEKWVNKLDFKATLGKELKPGELITKGMLTFDSPESKDQNTAMVDNVLLIASEENKIKMPDVTVRPQFAEGSAWLTSKDRAELDQVVKKLKDLQITSIYVEGHTCTMRIGKNLRHIYADNYELSRARAKSVAEYLGAALGLSPDQIKTAGKGPDKPIASNATLEGKIKNRRVEVYLSTAKTVQETTLKMKKDQDSTTAKTTGLYPGEKWETAEDMKSKATPVDEKRTVPIVYDEAWAKAQVQAEVVEKQSKPIADGKASPMIAIRFTDKDGHPIHQGVVGEYSVDPPYATQEEEDAYQEKPLTGLNKQKPRFVIGKNGIAQIKLQPTSQTGEVVVHVHFAEGDKDIRTWLKPEDREWILVGLAEGTAGYNSVSGNMESLDAADVEDKYYDDGRIAFFAKGKIKGKWLLTMAYDTEEPEEDKLFGTIDPDTYYTLYGDGSEQRYDAPSSKKLYVKIEKDKAYALFGDYDTGLTVTELSRYNRSFTGVKAEINDEHFEFNVFGAETDQGFVKDEIRGDGTSGLYQLSNTDIVINSEKITIETRDRFHSEVIVSSEKLTRHVDYNIDYETGTLFFREPIYSKDGNFNPIFIVAEYETTDANDEAYTYGGRGAVKLMDDKVKVGATYVHEEQGIEEADLAGMDTTVKIGKNTQIKGEYAMTSKDVGEDGDAYLAEVTHAYKKFEGKAYVREQDEDFGLGQQNFSETGTRKFGADASYDVTRKLSVNTELYHQDNLVIDAKRDVGEATTKYTEDQYSVYAGARHAEDELDDGTTYTSEQALVGASVDLLDDRIQLRADHEQSLSDKNENPDFPTRTIVGADYELNDTTTLFAEHEITSGEYEDTEASRVGMKATPWKGGQVGTSVGREYNEYGQRVFTNLGLKQTWNMNEKWSFDTGLDSTRTIKDPGNTPFNVNVPPASGNGYVPFGTYGSDSDFIAVSLGAAYRAEEWSWTSRVEQRLADDEDKWGLITGIYTEPKDGLGLCLGTRLFRTEYDSGGDRNNGDVRLGFAYRPIYVKWIVLDRLDYIFEEEDGTGNEYDNWRIVNNTHANYKYDKTQIALQYGAKYVREEYGGDTYSGYTDLAGLEGRYDITERWDIGLRGSVLHTWDTEQFDYSTGVSLGRDIAKNMWLSLGYNFVGFEDEDFSKADFTAQGPFVKFRVKFDQETAKDILEWVD